SAAFDGAPVSSVACHIERFSEGDTGERTVGNRTPRPNKDQFEDVSLLVPTTWSHGLDEGARRGKGVQVNGWGRTGGQRESTYTIFEGTSEIQRLVIARAISGVHIP